MSREMKLNEMQQCHVNHVVSLLCRMCHVGNYLYSTVCPLICERLSSTLWDSGKSAPCDQNIISFVYESTSHDEFQCYEGIASRRIIQSSLKSKDGTGRRTVTF